MLRSVHIVARYTKMTFRYNVLIFRKVYCLAALWSWKCQILWLILYFESLMTLLWEHQILLWWCCFCATFCREIEKLWILQHSVVFSPATIVPSSGPLKCHIISHLWAITCIVFFMHLIYILVEILTAQVVDTKTRMTHILF